VREAFIDALSAAELANQPPTAPLPSNYPAGNAGDATVAILGAKQAHVLYVEVHQLVPWRLAAYGDADLKRLFWPCKYPQAWCDLANPMLLWRVADYSPRETWNLVASKIDVTALTTQAETVALLMRHVRDFLHGSGEVGMQTMVEMATSQISAAGCQTTVPYFLALVQALNIPSEGTYGYIDAGDHATALIPFTDDVLAHGDDPYNGLMSATPSAELFDSYAYWKSSVIKKGQYNQTAAYNAQVYTFAKARQYPSLLTRTGYCQEGRPFLFEHWTTNQGVYMTTAQADALEALILQQTQGCTVFTEDAPDV
jgi:hypothetical protein